MKRRTTFLMLDPIITYCLGALSITFIIDELGMTPMTWLSMSVHLKSPIIDLGNFGLLNEQTCLMWLPILLDVPTVVHMVRPLFPERLASITGVLPYSVVISVRQLVVAIRVGIGHRKVTPKLLP